jgi:hypothetical protein
MSGPELQTFRVTLDPPVVVKATTAADAYDMAVAHWQQANGHGPNVKPLARVLPVEAVA